MENLEKNREGQVIAEKEKNLSIVQEYIEDLGLSMEDLRDKKILDVGSGSAEFARASRALGLECAIYSIDPGFVPSEEGSEAKERFFQAEAEHLPFENNTFELTVSRLAVPMMVNNPERMEMAIREMVRVTKDDREIRLSPIDQVVYFPDTKTIKPTSKEWWADEHLKQNIEAILDQLVREGHKVEIGQVTHRIKEFDGKEADLEMSFAIIKKARKK